MWRWIWLVGAVGFGLGEIATAGTFFLLPFAIGGAVAALLAFADVNVAVQWLVFLGTSVALLAAMRPLARRLDRDGLTEGIGSKRLIGEAATVLEAIPAGPNELGLVRVHREEWRAESVAGESVASGTLVRVIDQRGTRLVVAPTAQLPGESP